MELEITWGRVLKVWWAYFWRSIIAIVASIIFGGLVGFVLGFIMGAMGVAPHFAKYTIGPLGVIIGLGFSVIPMKMILGKDFGPFRLVLVAK